MNLLLVHKPIGGFVMFNNDQFNLFTETDENGIENDRETLEVIQCNYVSTDRVKN